MSKTVKDKCTDEAVDEFIDQPVDGLLYDLNMLPEVLKVHDKEDTKDWLIMRIIQRLHKKANSETES